MKICLGNSAHIPHIYAPYPHNHSNNLHLILQYTFHVCQDTPITKRSLIATYSARKMHYPSLASSILALLAAAPTAFTWTIQLRFHEGVRSCGPRSNVTSIWNGTKEDGCQQRNTTLKEGSVSVDPPGGEDHTAFAVFYWGEDCDPSTQILGGGRETDRWVWGCFRDHYESWHVWNWRDEDKGGIDEDNWLAAA